MLPPSPPWTKELLPMNKVLEGRFKFLLKGVFVWGGTWLPEGVIGGSWFKKE